MSSVVWAKVKGDLKDEIEIIAYEQSRSNMLGMGRIVGYNGILKGDKVIYEGKEYTVVMVSRMGDFGLSEDGELPYSIRVEPKDVVKVEGRK